MAFYTLIGLIVVAAVLAAGVYWVTANISFKRQPERYTYMKDESVQDNSVESKDEPDAKA